MLIKLPKKNQRVQRTERGEKTNNGTGKIYSFWKLINIERGPMVQIRRILAGRTTVNQNLKPYLALLFRVCCRLLFMFHSRFNGFADDRWAVIKMLTSVCGPIYIFVLMGRSIKQFNVPVIMEPNGTQRERERQTVNFCPVLSLCIRQKDYYYFK